MKTTETTRSTYKTEMSNATFYKEVTLSMYTGTQRECKNVEHKYTVEEDIQNVQTESDPYTDMASTQQHQKKFS